VKIDREKQAQTLTYSIQGKLI